MHVRSLTTLLLTAIILLSFFTDAFSPRRGSVLPSYGSRLVHCIKISSSLSSNEEGDKIERKHSSASARPRGGRAFVKGISNVLSGKAWDGSSIITKEVLSAFMGNLIISYSLVSNVSYISCVILAWIAHGKKFRCSPFSPGQWKQFLLIYSGLWIANTVIRPARFCLSLLLCPIIDKIVRHTQSKLRIGQAKATLLVGLTLNLVGSILYLVVGIFLAAKLARVPLLP